MVINNCLLWHKVLLIKKNLYGYSSFFVAVGHFNEPILVTQTNPNQSFFFFFFFLKIKSDEHTLFLKHVFFLNKKMTWVDRLNDYVAHSRIGKYFQLDHSGARRERKGTKFTTEIRAGLTTFFAMVIYKNNTKMDTLIHCYIM